ncbi:hypothetical protein [Bradyrhizobium sp. CCBAU 11445]|uniref:hypothetical protein n=1 Tax=Bradyrhizobium sp. CCBAU 11445 TaxID=1630896 RepID=UPI002305EF95|nr:hypothetical protein [Bradyrhizobium sp. CCBAU 11445]
MDIQHARFEVPCAPIEEQRFVTSHTIQVHGRTLSYKSTAGTLTIRDEDGDAHGSLFYVSYKLVIWNASS